METLLPNKLLDAFGICYDTDRKLRNSLTFLYDAALIVQHALHLTAPHVHQTSLIHERLPAVKACAVRQVGPHRDQKANVVFPQPWKNEP